MVTVAVSLFVPKDHDIMLRRVPATDNRRVVVGPRLT